jgi:lipoprotein-releasing system permease protein
MFKPLFLFIGTRYTDFKRRDHFITFMSLVSIFGIAIGVMVLITVLSVMNGFTQELRERIFSITPHLMINGWGDPMENWEAVSEAIKGHPDIEASAPYIDGIGMLTLRGKVEGVAIKGIDPNSIESVFPLKNAIKEGSVDKLQPGEYGAILGTNLAKSLNIKVGDKLTLLIPDPSRSSVGISPRLANVTVVGIFEVGYVYDNAYAFLNIEDAGALFKMHGGVSGVQVKLTDPFAAPRVRDEIYQDLHGLYNVVDWTLLNEHYFSAIKMQKTMLFFTLIMILAIAVFNLVSTLVMIVTGKRADIGVLRALGASTQKIMAIFISQGAIIGMIGTCLGIILGVILSLNVTRIVAWIEQVFSVKLFATDAYFLTFLPSQLRISDIAFVAVCALILSLLATIHPAWRGAKVQPATALRQDK